MPALSYTVADFVPLTKIISADVNSKFTSVKSRLNWNGTDATTGLDDTNIISNTVSGEGLTRGTKIKKGVAKAFIGNDSTGAITDYSSSANQTLYTNASGDLTAGALSLAAGGFGTPVTLTSVGDVLQVNSGVTAFVSAAPPTPAASRVYNFYQFT